MLDQLLGNIPDQRILRENLLTGRCRVGFLWYFTKHSYKHQLHMPYSDRF